MFYYAPRIERPRSVRTPLYRIVKYSLFNELPFYRKHPHISNSSQTTPPTHPDVRKGSINRMRDHLEPVSRPVQPNWRYNTPGELAQLVDGLWPQLKEDVITEICHTRGEVVGWLWWWWWWWWCVCVVGGEVWGRLELRDGRVCVMVVGWWLWDGGVMLWWNGGWQWRGRVADLPG